MLLTKATVNRANFLVGNKNYVSSITIIIGGSSENRRSGETIRGNRQRYPRTATVMLQITSRRDHPWQYRQSQGGPYIARGDSVHTIIVDLWGDHPRRHKQSGGPLLGGTDYCMTDPLYFVAIKGKKIILYNKLF